MHVSAKDKGTGKEQSMTITGGSSLSKEDIERMVREGEEHAAEDKKRREAAETRNVAEQLAYSIDKLLKDNADKLPEDVKTEVQADVDALKSALAGDDDDAVKTAFDKLSESQQKIGQAHVRAGPGRRGRRSLLRRDTRRGRRPEQRRRGHRGCRSRRRRRDEVAMANKNKKSSNSPGDREPRRAGPRGARRPRQAAHRPRDGRGAASGVRERCGARGCGGGRRPADDDTFTEEDLAFLTDLAAEAEADAKIAAPESSLAAERLADLQRLQAEYVNYRKRVQRDRETARENAIAEVVKSLLPILDDLDRAHAHGDLEGSPLDLVAQKLRSSFERYGLTAVGAKGDVFDHNLHEAIYQQPSPDVTVNTVADVIESGYLLGEKLLRPAKVAVDVPAE